MLTTNYMSPLYIYIYALITQRIYGRTHEARIMTCGLSSCTTGMRYDLILSIKKQGSEKQYTPLLLYP